MSLVCSGCGAAWAKGVVIHKPGCLRGAAITGGEYESAAAHADARHDTEECMERDYQTLRSRGEAR